MFPQMFVRNMYGVRIRLPEPLKLYGVERCFFFMLTNVDNRSTNYGYLHLPFWKSDQQKAKLAGLAHDIGKYSDAFQKCLHGAPIQVDHSTAGAVECWQRRKPFAAFAAFPFPFLVRQNSFRFSSYIYHNTYRPKVKTYREPTATFPRISFLSSQGFFCLPVNTLTVPREKKPNPCRHCTNCKKKRKGWNIIARHLYK